MSYISDYIKNEQPILSRAFSHAIASNTVSHAYLLSGEVGSPLKDIALYLAKSILCDSPSPLADESCLTCKRIEKGEYPDLIILDGDGKNKSKDDVTEVIETFSETPLEKKGVMIYIVNKIEGLGLPAVNSLLKFLEEPPSNTIAIITTENEEKILSTIKSRCQCIRLLSRPREKAIADCIKADLPKEDYEILSFFFTNAETIESMKEDNDYQAAKQAALTYAEALQKGREYSRFVMEKDVIPTLKGKVANRYFFDIVGYLIKDAIYIKQGQEPKMPSYDTISRSLIKALPSVEQALLRLFEQRAEIETNINPGLLLTHLSVMIFKE